MLMRCVKKELRNGQSNKALSLTKCYLIFSITPSYILDLLQYIIDIQVAL